jgi:hypothetical protein
LELEDKIKEEEAVKPIFPALHLTEFLLFVHVQLLPKLPSDKSPVWRLLEKRLPLLRSNTLASYQSSCKTWFNPNPPRGIHNESSNGPLLSLLQCFQHIKDLTRHYISNWGPVGLSTLLQKIETAPASPDVIREGFDYDIARANPSARLENPIRFGRLLRLWLSHDSMDFARTAAFCGLFATEGRQMGLQASLSYGLKDSNATWYAAGPVIVHDFDTIGLPEDYAFAPSIVVKDLRTGADRTYSLRCLVAVADSGQAAAYLQKVTTGTFDDSQWYRVHDERVSVVAEDVVPMNMTDWPEKPYVLIYVIDLFDST